MRTRSKQTLGLALLAVGLAVGGFGLPLLLGADRYLARARMYVKYAEADGVDGPNFSAPSYDPYLIQNTFEIIRSPLILSNVIANLKLDEIRSRKHLQPAKLTSTEAMAIINSHLSLTPIRCTSLIDITFASQDPKEPAQVANAIAEAYWDYRTRLRRESTPILQQRFREEESQLQEFQAKVDSLKQQVGITNNFPPADMMQHIEQSRTYHLEELPGQAYWAEKQKLDQMAEAHQRLGSRMEADKSDLQLPRTALVKITDPAVPPTAPIGPNRSLGGGLSAAGLLLIIPACFLLATGFQNQNDIV